MYTIKKRKEKEYIIKNSKFICLIYPINNFENIVNYLKETKNKYRNATHFCFAYSFENFKKYSDDKEPNGTAGFPMMQVLEKNNLENILVITVRYFGGIKLGTGPLTRAYSNCVINTLEKKDFILLESGMNIDIIFDYKLEKEISYLIKEFNIISKQYLNNVIYNVDVSNDIYQKLKQLDIKINIKKNKLITKSDL